MTRDSGIIYRSYYEAISSLSDESQLALYKALMAYIFDGDELPLEGMDKVVFTLIKPNLDANNKRFENGKKGAEFGVLGGAPKGNQNARKVQKSTVKQPRNNPETTANQGQNNPKTTPNKDKDVDKDKELDNNNPLTPLQGGTGAFLQMISASALSEPLQEKLREWLRYKTERREGYKPQGLRSLLTTAERMAETYGEAAVAAAIDASMANNWQGIIWDRLGKQPKKQAAAPKGIDYSGECDL